MKDQFKEIQELIKIDKPNITNPSERIKLSPQWKKDEQKANSIKDNLGIIDTQEVKIEGLRRDGICE